MNSTNSYLKLFFQYGFVFGIEFLSAFIASQVCAYYGSRINLSKSFIIGSVIVGVFGVLFGTLICIQDADLFIVSSYSIR